MKNLNTCPYCNGIPKVKKTSIKFIENNIDKYYVECSDCGAATIQYDTFFGYSSGGKFQVLSEKDAVGLATADWNERKFNAYTKLSHMSYKDKVIWQIRSLLTDAWYGAMVPMDSPEWKTAWKLRKVAEDRGLLVLQSKKQYDLGEVARTLFNDIQVKDIIFGYFEEVNNMNLNPDEIREWNLYFNNFIEGKEYIKPSIKDRISGMLMKIGM
ncbi:hypothetical protein AALB52_25050 [Lachnospiraceae bacterium 38-14]